MTVLAIILLMIFKTIENLQDDVTRSMPSPLVALVRARDNMQAAIGRRLGFQRHVDETDIEEHQVDANDDDADEANRQHGTVETDQQRGKRAGLGDTHATGSATWPGVADLLKKLFFTIYLIIYFSFMFAYLC